MRACRVSVVVRGAILSRAGTIARLCIAVVSCSLGTAVTHARVVALMVPMVAVIVAYPRFRATTTPELDTDATAVLPLDQRIRATVGSRRPTESYAARPSVVRIPVTRSTCVLVSGDVVGTTIPMRAMDCALTADDRTQVRPMAKDRIFDVIKWHKMAY